MRTNVSPLRTQQFLSNGYDLRKWNSSRREAPNKEKAKIQDIIRPTESLMSRGINREGKREGAREIRALLGYSTWLVLEMHLDSCSQEGE